jgi:hypothetical protein
MRTLDTFLNGSMTYRCGTAMSDVGEKLITTLVRLHDISQISCLEQEANGGIVAADPASRFSQGHEALGIQFHDMIREKNPELSTDIVYLYPNTTTLMTVHEFCEKAHKELGEWVVLTINEASLDGYVAFFPLSVAEEIKKAAEPELKGV